MATDESAPDGAKVPSEDTPGAESRAASEAAADQETAAGQDSTSSGRTPAEFAEAGAEALIEAAFCTGDFGPARELLEKARDGAAAAGDRLTEAVSIERLANLAHYENITKHSLWTGGVAPAEDAEAEEKLFRQALAICQELDDQAGMARAALGVGLVFQVLRQDWPTAMPYYWQALELSPALEGSGDLRTRSEIHRHLGFYFHYEGASPGEAVRHLQLSLDLREQLGDPRLLPSALVALGEAELAAGNSDRAVELLTRAVAGAQGAGLHPQRVEDAERALREAQAAADGSAPANGAEAEAAEAGAADAGAADAGAADAGAADAGAAEAGAAEAGAAEAGAAEAGAPDGPGPDGPASDGPASDGPGPGPDSAASDGPAPDSAASDGPASDGPASDGPAPDGPGPASDGPGPESGAA